MKIFCSTSCIVFSIISIAIIGNIAQVYGSDSINYEGNLKDIPPEMLSTIEVGDLFRLEFDLSSVSEDPVPDPSFGDYFGISGILNLGTKVIQADECQASVVNSNIDDFFLACKYDSSPETFDGWKLWISEITLRDNSGSCHSSDEFIYHPDFECYDSKTFRMQFEKDETFVEVTGNITSISNEVPSEDASDSITEDLVDDNESLVDVVLEIDQDKSIINICCTELGYNVSRPRDLVSAITVIEVSNQGNQIAKNVGVLGELSVLTAYFEAVLDTEYDPDQLINSDDITYSYVVGPTIFSKWRYPVDLRGDCEFSKPDSTSFYCHLGDLPPKKTEYLTVLWYVGCLHDEKMDDRQFEAETDSIESRYDNNLWKSILMPYLEEPAPLSDWCITSEDSFVPPDKFSPTAGQIQDPGKQLPELSTDVSENESTSSQDDVDSPDPFDDSEGVPDFSDICQYDDPTLLNPKQYAQNDLGGDGDYSCPLSVVDAQEKLFSTGCGCDVLLVDYPGAQFDSFLNKYPECQRAIEITQEWDSMGCQLENSQDTNKAADVPDWVKNNAGWWNQGSISDKEFATGIGFLVKEKIISVKVPISIGGSLIIPENLKIPDWIKNNAKWYSDGEISEKEFLAAIEFMINNGIIDFSNDSEPAPIVIDLPDELLKGVFLIYKENELFYNYLLEIKNYKVEYFKSQADSYWKTYSEDKNQNIANLALEYEQQSKDSQEDAKKLVDYLKKSRTLTERAKQNAIDKNVSILELESSSKIIQEELDSIKQAKSTDELKKFQENAQESQKSICKSIDNTVTYLSIYPELSQKLSFTSSQIPSACDLTQRDICDQEFFTQEFLTEVELSKTNQILGIQEIFDPDFYEGHNLLCDK